MNSSRELLVPRDKRVGGLSPAGREISAALMGARGKAAALAGFPGTVPADLFSAYEIQSHSIGSWPDDVAGWKVGGIPPKWREKLGAEWLVGPIFASSVNRYDGTQRVAMPVFTGGFAAIEPELVIRLGKERPEDRIFIGAEIASSPVPAINDYLPTAVICDFGNNNGLLIGKEIDEWAAIDAAIEVSIWIDDKLIGRRVLDDLADGALAARDFCLDHASRHGRSLLPGTLISTGAITGVHEAELGAQSTISFGELGNLELELVPAKPVQR